MKEFRRISIEVFVLLALISLGWAQGNAFHKRQLKLAKVPAIGDLISASEKDTRTECMVNSAQLDPCVDSTIGGVKYTVAFRKRDSGDYFVTRVSTLDSKFISPEGLRMGDKITVNGPEEIFEAPYFEVYARRGTRWIPIIGMFGKVNLDFDGKKLIGDDIEKLWSLGPKPVQLVVEGFIEVATKN
jgi:hypothetical protein